MPDANLPDLSLPNVSEAEFDVPSVGKLNLAGASTHPPRILLLYGSLRERSYSRFLTLEAERILCRFGAETRVFDPRGLPVVDSVAGDHPKVQSYGDSRSGPRDRSGAARSGTALSPAS
jgi:arsenical resistance protein ArsH